MSSTEDGKEVGMPSSKLIFLRLWVEQRIRSVLWLVWRCTWGWW
jgi:hypothetical protein